MDEARVKYYRVRFEVHVDHVWDNASGRYYPEKWDISDEVDKWRMADDTVEEYFWKCIE